MTRFYTVQTRLQRLMRSAELRPVEWGGPQILPEQPRVLILAYFYPPVAAVASIRASCIAKYLALRGWCVNVVTPAHNYWSRVDPTTSPDPALNHPPTVIESRHSLPLLSPYVRLGSDGQLAQSARRLCARMGRGVLPMLGLDFAVGWDVSVYRLCRKMALLRQTDVILATGAPFSSFLTAAALARKMQCPYVVDYRDLWYDNPHASLRVSGIRMLERGLLRGAGGVTVYSESAAKALSQRYEFSAPICVVTNGYDPDHLQEIEPLSLGDKAIVYTGAFYPPIRSADPIMRLLASLTSSPRDSSEPWLFHYYGPSSAHVLSLARKYQVMEYVRDHGMVPRREALAAVAGARVAVVVTNLTGERGIAGDSIVTGKLFEPLGLGTPVLMIASHPGDASRIMGQGGRWFTPDDLHGMSRYLNALASQVARARQPVPECSWPLLAGRLDRALRDSIERFTSCHAR